MKKFFFQYYTSEDCIHTNTRLKDLRIVLLSFELNNILFVLFIVSKEKKKCLAVRDNK
jgi:hypothetical protein